MHTIGDKPGAGTYLCLGCQHKVILESDDDMLPFCKNCENTWFIRVH